MNRKIIMIFLFIILFHCLVQHLFIMQKRKKKELIFINLEDSLWTNQLHLGPFSSIEFKEFMYMGNL